jgi:hypothetical protein
MMGRGWGLAQIFQPRKVFRFLKAKSVPIIACVSAKDG